MIKKNINNYDWCLNNISKPSLRHIYIYIYIHTHTHICNVFRCHVTSDNDVNNQQDATNFSFINIFNSALHVSGDKFAHPQEHFLTVYTQLFVQCTDTAADWCRGTGRSICVLYFNTLQVAQSITLLYILLFRQLRNVRCISIEGKRPEYT